MYDHIYEIGLVAFTTFFATVGPLDVAATYAGLTARNTAKHRRVMALKGVLIATGLLLIFAFFGNDILALFGISLPALKIAGGILLLIIAIELVFTSTPSSAGATAEDTEEASLKEDISVFPLAIPLISGPGAIGAAILLGSNTAGRPLEMAAVLTGLLGVMALTLATLLMASQLQKLLGRTGMNVISRVIGVLLAALAVEFVIDGIKQSGVLTTAL